MVRRPPGSSRPHPLSLRDALPISMNKPCVIASVAVVAGGSAMAAYQSRLFGDYAQIVKVDEITKTVNVTGEVLDTKPITESRTGPREVCEDKEIGRAHV